MIEREKIVLNQERARNKNQEREILIMKLRKIKIAATSGKVFQYFIIIFILMISLYPIIWVFISSFKKVPGGLSLPTEWIFDGYITIFTKLNVLTYFGNSLFITVIATFLSVIIVTMSAYVCSRLQFRGRTIITFMFASTLFIPQYAISFPIYRLMNTLGLYDTRVGLISVYTGLNIAISFFIIKGYFTSIPKEMEEAAKVDGCSYFGTFFKSRWGFRGCTGQYKSISHNCTFCMYLMVQKLNVALTCKY